MDTEPGSAKQHDAAVPKSRFGRGLLKSTIGMMGGRLTQPFFTFVLFFFSARLLTTSQFGFYVFIMGMVILFQSICSLGLGQVLSREIGQHPEKEGIIIGSVLCLSLPASLVAAVLFLGLSYALMGGGEYFYLSLICAVALPFSTVIQFGESIFLAHNAGGRLFRIGMLEQTVRLILCVGALFYGYGLYGLIGGYAIGRLLAAVIITALFFKTRMSPPLQIERENLGYIWRRLAAFVPLTLLANLYFRADIIVLAWLMTESDLGLYGCAIRITSFSFIAPESITIAALPHFSHHWAERKDGIFDKKAAAYANLFIGLGFLGAAAMAVFGGTLLTAFFGAKYAPSGPLLAILGFMLPAHSINTLLGFLFQISHKEKTALWLSGLATAVVFCAIALGTVLYGVTGAAIGSVASVWLLAILHLYVARKELLKLPKGSPIIRSTIVFVAGWGFLVLLKPEGILPFCLLAAGVGLAALVFGGLLDGITPRRIKEAFE